MKMYFSLAAYIVLSVAFAKTTRGNPVNPKDNILYSGQENLFQVLDTGAVQITPLNGKRQLQFCNYWDAVIGCQLGLSDTNICEDTYCSCNGVNLDCKAGTTCDNTCFCDVLCIGLDG